MSEAGYCKGPCPEALKLKADVMDKIAETREDSRVREAEIGRDLNAMTSAVDDLRQIVSSLPGNIADAIKHRVEELNVQLKRGTDHFDEIFTRLRNLEQAQVSDRAASKMELESAKAAFKHDLNDALAPIKRHLQIMWIAVAVIALGRAAMWAWPYLEKLLKI